jgi:hypothetical protein
MKKKNQPTALWKEGKKKAYDLKKKTKQMAFEATGGAGCHDGSVALGRCTLQGTWSQPFYITETLGHIP